MPQTGDEPVPGGYGQNCRRKKRIRRMGQNGENNLPWIRIVYINGAGMEKDRKLLSLVVPCYNEEAVLMLFYDRCINALDMISDSTDYEIIFVDDGSTDRSLEIMKELSHIDIRVKYISFSRNFGKEAGIYAGLSKAKGDYVVLMDGDCQHPPECIPEMLEICESGEWDCAAMKRLNRKDVRRSKLSSKFFGLMSSMCGFNLPEGATEYRMMTRCYVEAVLMLAEKNRFTKGIFEWVGFKTKWLGYKDEQRAAGSSKWSVAGLLRYSLEGIFSFSQKPFEYMTGTGAITAGISFITLLFCVLLAIFDIKISGTAAIILFMLMIGGVLLMSIGIVGLNMSKVYAEVKGRPAYIIKEDNLD